MANKVVHISATQKLISDIAEKVKKTFGVIASKGIIAKPADLAGNNIELSLDENYIKQLAAGSGGDTYTFKGDDYISVSVDGVNQ